MRTHQLSDGQMGGSLNDAHGHRPSRTLKAHLLDAGQRVTVTDSAFPDQPYSWRRIARAKSRIDVRKPDVDAL